MSKRHVNNKSLFISPYKKSRCILIQQYHQSPTGNLVLNKIVIIILNFYSLHMYTYIFMLVQITFMKNNKAR
jgi:hypothetical protein